MILLQGLYCCAVGNGPETGTGISQVVFDGVLIKERCSSVRRTPALRKINGFQVRAGIFDAADIVFRSNPGNKRIKLTSYSQTKFSIKLISVCILLSYGISILFFK